MLYIAQLEPLEERYTEQWSRWIPEALEELGYGFKVVNGETLTDSIEVGDVLDVYGTHHWKFTQLNKLISMIRSGEISTGDTIWFADLWTPGIEALAYIRSMTGIKFKISGVLHAGTWDKNDFTYRNNMQEWAEGFEQTMFDIADEIHLGSQFHKDMILQSSKINVSEDKLKVTGLFFNPFEIRSRASSTTKRPLVLFPHRLAPEKQPEAFDRLAECFKDTGYEFVKTMDLNLSKDEYYKLLSEAEYTVSFKGQETFGYSTLEALALGVNTLTFDGMSYKETVPDELRWTTEEDLHKKLLFRKKASPEVLAEHAEKFLPRTVINRMFS